MHFRQNATDGPHVDRSVVINGTEQEFGGTIATCRHLSGVTPFLSVVVSGQRQTAQAEIRDFQYALGTDQQIGRFQVLNNNTRRHYVDNTKLELVIESGFIRYNNHPLDII